MTFQVYYDLAELYTQMKQWEEAQRVIDRALQLWTGKTIFMRVFFVVGGA